MQAYSQAIEEQAAMLRHVRNVGTSRLASEAQQGHLYKGLAEHYQPALKQMSLTLETAAPFYWDADLCGVLEAAAPTLPDWEIDFAKLPAVSGYVLFGHALHLPMPDERVIKQAIADGKRPGHLPLDYRLDMTGMAWQVISEDQIFLASFLRTSQRLNGEPGLMHINDAGTNLHELIRVLQGSRRNPSVWEDTDMEQSHEALMKMRAELQIRYIATALDFINQPLLTTRKHHQPDRGTRKRMQRAGQAVPDVEVVELRRKQYLSVDEPDEAPTEREYRHRWFVGMATGGYWQHYHTNQGTIRRLILPYMKLADRTDLPIKQPRSTVYVVDR